MNIWEKRNLTYHLTSAAIILLNLGFDAYVLSYVIMNGVDNITVSLVACIAAALMMIFEIVIFLRGGKKDSVLYKIAFNPNEKINNVPLIAVSIFAFIGLGFIVMGTLLNVLKHVEPFVSTSLIILVVAVYLISNCLIYYLYCLMFRKREFKLEDLIK